MRDTLGFIAWKSLRVRFNNLEKRQNKAISKISKIHLQLTNWLAIFRLNQKQLDAANVTFMLK